jgi:hypothetical protein
MSSSVARCRMGGTDGGAPDQPPLITFKRNRRWTRVPARLMRSRIVGWRFLAMTLVLLITA